jgi:hypothetical protein
VARPTGLLLLVALLGASACSSLPPSAAGPAWTVPAWPSRGFSAPADTRPPWMPETPPAWPPGRVVPDDGFHDQLALL